MLRSFANRLAIGLLVVTVACVAAGLGYRSYRQNQLAESLVIDTPDGIDEGRFVDVNGSEQWVTIRGADRGNPIVLFLHGGPGEVVSLAPSVTRVWEDDFIVVHWDQRGAGRTYGRNPKPPANLSLAQLRDDGLAITLWLTRYLGKRRVILVGHSWGSILGLHMLNAQPELFSAYVGTGQFVSWTDQVEAQYSYVRSRVRTEENPEVSARLSMFDEAPASDMNRYLEFRSLLRPYLAAADLEFASGQVTELLVAPRASLVDIWHALRGARASLDALGGTLLGADLRELGGEVKTPFVLIQGDDDWITPARLARDFANEMDAPAKAVIEIPEAGHYAFVTHAAEFRDALLSRVLPLIEAAEPR